MPIHIETPRRAAASAGAGLCALVATLLATPALAAPEEIEVYRNELGDPGRFALEVNQNYVFTGSGAVDFTGQQAGLHRYRLTPELSYGLTPTLELGALAVGAIGRDGRIGVHGAKARLRYIAPHGETGAYWGANLEVGRVDRSQSVYPWGVELRTILGYEGRRWVIAVNPTLEGSLGGPAPEPLSLGLASKLGYRLSDRLLLGLESYNDFGPLRRLSPLRDEEQMLYLSLDAALKGFGANVGIGRGLTPTSDG